MRGSKTRFLGRFFSRETREVQFALRMTNVEYLICLFHASSPFSLLLELKWQKMWFINTRYHANIKFEENKRQFRSKLGNKGFVQYE